MPRERLPQPERYGELLQKLTSICTRDLGSRGMGPLSLGTAQGLAGAAESLLDEPNPHVVLITGFFVPNGSPPSAETDGPVGAAHLAVAFGRVGIPVTVVTDEPCEGGVRAGLVAAGVDAAKSLAVVPLDVAPEDIVRSIEAGVIGRGPFTHSLSIERVGPAADGRPHNIRGGDMSTFQAPLHRLFMDAAPVRIAVGDGGNELGMGALPRALIARSIPCGADVACITPCEHLIVCGVSNWGAAALLIAMALRAPSLRSGLLKTLTPTHDRQLLERIIRDGPAVDGITGTQVLSVDGISEDIHGDQLEEMLSVAANGWEQRRNARVDNE
jgi:D-glutamate cyclase